MKTLGGKTALSSLALVSLLASASAQTAFNYNLTGSFAASAVIQPKTAVNTSDQVWCHVKVALATGANLYSEGSQRAALNNGVYTCSISLPFDWRFNSGVSLTSFPYTIVMDAYIVNAATTSPSLVGLNLGEVRHANKSDGTGALMIAGNNGRVVIPAVPFWL